jgi:hypothetical protein
MLPDSKTTTTAITWWVDENGALAAASRPSLVPAIFKLDRSENPHPPHSKAATITVSPQNGFTRAIVHFPITLAPTTQEPSEANVHRWPQVRSCFPYGSTNLATSHRGGRRRKTVTVATESRAGGQQYKRRMGKADARGPGSAPRGLGYDPAGLRGPHPASAPQDVQPRVQTLRPRSSCLSVAHIHRHPEPLRKRSTARPGPSESLAVNPNG